MRFRKGLVRYKYSDFVLLMFTFLRNIYERSKWCSIFTEEDLVILEYGQDLKSYYKSGYGREIQNKKLGCPILRDLYTKLSNTVAGTLHIVVKIVLT